MLTNAHTHLELTALARLCPREPTELLSWLGKVLWARWWTSERKIRKGIERGIADLEACGTSFLGDISSTGLSLEPLFRSRLKGSIFLEVLGLNREKALQKLAETQAAIQEFRRRSRNPDLQVGLSLHAPYSCHPELLRAGAAWCRKEEAPLCIHAAEAPFETEWLLSGKISRGPRSLRWVGKGLKNRPFGFPGLRPIPYLASLGVLAARPLLVHAVQVTTEDIRFIRESGCAVVHCPRSNYLLSGGRMPLELYLEENISVYLGTDSLASSPSLDIREEAVFAQQIHSGRVSPDRIAKLLEQPFPPSKFFSDTLS
jgi:aminodeoxyfutalosine deaminase